MNMNFSEIDKDVLFQEIQQIQNTLETNNTLAGLTNINNDEEISDDEVISANKSHPQGYSYYQQYDDDEEEDSDFIDSSGSDNESSYQIYETKEPSRFGHFFDALKIKSSDNENQPSASGISDNVKKRIQGQSIYDNDGSQSPKIYHDFSTPIMSPAQSSTNEEEEEAKSIDISIPSTYSTLPAKKKQQLSTANLYVERIFREFRKGYEQPTLSTVNKFDTRTLKSSGRLETMEQLLLLNRSYQETLADELKIIRIALTKNGLAQDEMSKTSNTGVEKLGKGSLYRSCLGRFGVPYFKDADGFGPDDNEDTKKLKQISKVNVFSKGGRTWTSYEIKSLREGVYNSNLEKRLDPLLQRLKQYDKEYREKKLEGKTIDRSGRAEITKQISDIKALPMDEILKESYDIDFMKVAKNFVPDREDFECQIYWCNVLHPSINQNKFTKEEDSKLIKLAKKYKNHRWEDIAKELDTNRTPVQCLQRFQRTLNKDIIKSQWTQQDDDRLIEGIKLYQRDWILVADHVEGKTQDQCIHRWEHTLNPNIKRGKWSQEEDEALMEAVLRLGRKNWKAAKESVPGRTAAQCRERFVSRLDPDINATLFSFEEDELLIELVNQFGIGKWSMMTKYFDRRQDSFLLRRYKQIMPKKYAEYQNEVLAKKKHVLTYFMHREDEKRDYDIKELDLEVGEVRKPSEKTKKTNNNKKKKEPETPQKEKRRRNANPLGIPIPTNLLGKRGAEEKNKEEEKEYGPTVTYYLDGFAQVIDVNERLKLVLDEVCMAEPKAFRARCNIAITDLKLKRVAPQTLKDEFEACRQVLLTRLPEKAELLEKILTETVRSADAFIEQVEDVIASHKKKMQAGEEQPQETQQPTTPSTIATSAASSFGRTSHHRKASKPLRVVEVGKVRRPINQDPITVDVSDEFDSDDSMPDTPRPPPMLGSQPPTKRPPVTETDQLKIFTWILQTLHIDTAGVMRSLPQKDLANSIKDQNPYNQGNTFPKCLPLSPNSSTLRGFRTLLLHRKRLSEQVNKSTTPINKEALQDTPMYNALSSRFKSMFVWPAFLATFMPRRAEELPSKKILDQTPTKLPQFNFNKRMNIPGRRVPTSPQTRMQHPMYGSASPQRNHSQFPGQPPYPPVHMHQMAYTRQRPGQTILGNPSPFNSSSSTTMLRHTTTSGYGHSRAEINLSPQRFPIAPSYPYRAPYAPVGNPHQRYMSQMVPFPMRAPSGHGTMQRPPTSNTSTQQRETTSTQIPQQDETSTSNPSDKGKTPLGRATRKRSTNNETTQPSATSKPKAKVKHTTKIWSQRSAELSDEKLSKLVDDYLNERKLNTKVLKVEPSEKSTDAQTSTSHQPKTSKDVFMPRHVLDPPAEKRQMLDNSVIALETGKEKDDKEKDKEERPKKRRKSQ
ncbi:uncharacterized protein [Clytia hemisphaerica]|uniref:Myb transcription factor n=1 Tax=Clytia hemisphaerica TaxID=252671 RepID=A0A7M5X324_9CNID